MRVRACVHACVLSYMSLQFGSSIPVTFQAQKHLPGNATYTGLFWWLDVRSAFWCLKAVGGVDCFSILHQSLTPKALGKFCGFEGSLTDSDRSCQKLI